MKYYHICSFLNAFTDISLVGILKRDYEDQLPHFEYEETEAQVIQIHLEAQQGPEHRDSDSSQDPYHKDLIC